MSRFKLAYLAGVKLALDKLESDGEVSPFKSEAHLRKVLKLVADPDIGYSADSSESVDSTDDNKQSKASWGDKIELEPNSTNGIEV